MAKKEFDQVVVVLPDLNQWTERRQIRSETSNRVYTISRHKIEGYWACSCPGWISSKKPFPERRCKHLKTIFKALGIDDDVKKDFLVNYRTYEGERGSPEQWQKAVTGGRESIEPVRVSKGRKLDL